MSSESPNPGTSTKKKGGCLKILLIGFGIAALILAACCWWMWNNWQDLAVGFGLDAIEASINSIDLEEQEKGEVKAELQRLRDGFEDKTISGEQFLKVAQGLAESPLMSMFMVTAIENGYVKNSGLSEEEKAAAKVTLQRFAHGMINEKISSDEMNEVLEPISDRQADGKMKIREKVTDEELRKFLTAATKKADAAEIPAEIEPIDPSDELKKVIDAALAPKPPAADEELKDEAATEDL